MRTQNKRKEIKEQGAFQRKITWDRRKGGGASGGNAQVVGWAEERKLLYLSLMHA